MGLQEASDMPMDSRPLRIIAAILLIGICLALFFVARGVVHKEPDRVVPSHIKERMKYHGVQVVYEDWEGKLYFRRNGKRCEL